MYPKNLDDAATYADLLRRIDALRPDTPHEWGKMDVAQMLSHCAEVQEVMNGKALKGTPFFIKWLGPLVKGMVLSTKPYPKNMRTHPQYVKNEPEEFDRQKARLRTALEATRARGSEGFRHPIFGPMTAEQTGWSAWKHLDHHLQQFGV